MDLPALQCALLLQARSARARCVWAGRGHASDHWSDLAGLLGYLPETRLAMPMAPAYVALAVWLMVKGFDERHRPLEAEAHAVQAGGA